jgi:hypothetical protein
MRIKIPFFYLLPGSDALFCHKKRFKLSCFNVNRGKSRVPLAGLRSIHNPQQISKLLRMSETHLGSI